MTNVIIAEKINPAAFEEIRFVQGEKKITESYPGYLVDESKISGGHAEWLFFPYIESQLATIVDKAKTERLRLTVSAARTGIVGSAVPYGGAVISLERMDEVFGIGFDEQEGRWYVRLQPGLALDQINEIVKLKKFEDKHNLQESKNGVERFKKEPTFYYPVDPTEMTASIGGTIAANASGARTFRYGATREWVRRLRVMLDSGEVLDITRGQYKAENGKFTIKTAGKDREITIPTYKMPKAKNAAGLYTEPQMDLIDLFIGSEGMFGIITEVDVWIKEYTSQISCVAFFKEEEDSLSFVESLRDNQKIEPEFIEFFDNNSLSLLRDKQKEDPKFVDMPDIEADVKAAISFDLSFSEEAIQENFKEIGKLLEEFNSSLEKTWCAYEERELSRFKHFRHAVPEIVNNLIAERKKQYPSIHKLGTDMSVVNQHLKEMMQFYHSTLEEANLEYCIWGHIGDNHVHVNILPKNMEELELGKQLYKKFAKKAVEFGGSVSAEHGIGKIKHEYLLIMFSEEEIKQMQKVKCQLDPEYIFNAGNVFVECSQEELV